MAMPVPMPMAMPGTSKSQSGAPAPAVAPVPGAVFTCPQPNCSQILPSELQYRLHLIDHEPTTKSIYPCNLCTYTCTIRELLKEHVATHFDSTKKCGFIKCSQCTFTTSYPAEFKKHSEDVHGGVGKNNIGNGIGSGSNGGYNYSSDIHNESFEIENVDDDDDDDYEDDDEGLSDSDGGGGMDDVDRLRGRDVDRPGSPGGDKFICSEEDCGLRFGREYDYLIHSYKHLPKNAPIRCPHCKYVGRNRPLIEQHIVIHFDVYPFRCEECDEDFKFKSALQKHDVAHHRSGSHKKRARARKRVLSSKHKTSKIKAKRSTGSRSREAENSSPLHIYNTNPKDPRPRIYVCSGPNCSCGKEFITEYEYELHKFCAVPPQDIYYCPKCDYQASIRTRVKYHMVHHFPGIYTAECPECQRLFKNIKDLSKHRRNVHRKVYPSGHRSGASSTVIIANPPPPESIPKTIHRPRIPSPPPPRSGPLSRNSSPNNEPVQPISENPDSLRRYNQTLQYFKNLPHAAHHKCPKCCYTSRIRKHVEEHLIVHFKNVYPYPCSYCPTMFKHVSGYRKHNHEVHGMRVSLLQPRKAACTKKESFEPLEPPRLSPVSPLQIPSTSNGVESYESQQQQFVCTETVSCRQLSFKSEFYYKSHLLSHQVPFHGLYKCSQCEYTNGKLKLVRFHFVKHFDVKPYECKWCDSKFKFKESLRKHKLRVHCDANTSSRSNSSNNSMEVDMEDEYNSTRPRREESRTLFAEPKLDVVENPEPILPDSDIPLPQFLCIRRNCFAVYDNELDYRIHEALHLPENLAEYKCLDCPLIFETKVEYGDHLLSHYTNDPIKCSLCNFFTQNKELFRSHKIDTHCTNNINEILEVESEENILANGFQTRLEEYIDLESGEEDEVLYN